MLPGTSESGNNTGTSGLSTSSMKTGPIATTYSGWDFTTIWNRDAGMNDGYPHLRVPESTAPESLFTWNGSVSNDWNTPANWSSNAVPTSMVDVKIPNTVSNYPTLSAAGVCKNITIQSGASLLGNGYLTVSGTAMVDRAIPGASQAMKLSLPVPCG